jgi:hypothetical protein
VTHTYDWSKLDAGWSVEPRSVSVRADALVHTTERGTDRHFAISELESDREPIGLHTSYWRMLWPLAQDQLAKCRVVECDHDWNDICTFCVKCGCAWGEAEPAPLDQYDDRCKAGEYELPNPGDVGQGDASEFVAPFQPWRRGPLAAWTLVNISNHDGRLTVVMKRGRGEVLIETGVDEDAIWERLALKAEAYTRDRMTTQGAT